MAKLPVAVVREMFFGQVKQSGEDAARRIYEKTYPYAAPFASTEEIKAHFAPKVRAVGPRKPFRAYTWPNAATPAAVSTAKPVTKLARAKALFAANPGASREQLIALFQKELAMSKAGATTYFYNAQK